MAIIITCQRIIELHIAKHNRIWALAAGAKEYGAKHYPLFFLLHIGWLLGWIWEFKLNNGVISEFWHLWLSLFICAQVLRYWCMVSLGQRWNTRILVIPDGEVICKGPYRFLSHPNYLAVAIEIISVPLIFNAIITAVVATFFNGILLVAIRIPQENSALRLLKKEPSKGFTMLGIKKRI